ncbi:hypothetical protein DV515_00007607 [Chloebia gouldiae]|uniref:Uncharacterized protein n=1 Tax=Chloebia gouldiae TaxID=44316 RepID=A0A3L8SIH1_CHLGU|nr:hypothetical protein DV515_00007607 [Chloebia gouldiae]
MPFRKAFVATRGQFLMDFGVIMPDFVPITAPIIESCTTKQQNPPCLQVLVQVSTSQAMVARWDNLGCHQLQVEPPLH